VRPFIAAPKSVEQVHYEQVGYIIAGSRHRLECRCYACGTVRLRAREKRLRMTLFNCG